jgi:hypothetical protein
MKKFFFYAFAVMTAMCMTACSSDDDNDDKKQNETVMPKPVNAEQSVQFALDTPKSPENVDDDAPQLKTIDFTESGDVLIEFKHPVSQSVVYIKDKASFNGTTYTMNGSKVKGTVKVAGQAARATRADNVELAVDIAVTFSTEKTYTYVTGEGETITVTKDAPPTGDQALDILARTWNVLGLILDLKGDDIKAFETWDAVGGVFDLETTVLKTALERDVNLSADEQKALKKKVKGVVITKTKLFALDYTDGTEDVASWNWADASKTGIRIMLKDDKMGNKFIQDATMISFAFNGDRCNMKLATTFTDNSNKKWNAVVTLQLQSPK